MKRPLVKKCPWWFGVWGGILQEAPGQKGPLVVLGFGAGSSKKALAKKGHWWFWGFRGWSYKRPLVKKGPW